MLRSAGRWWWQGQWHNEDKKHQLPWCLITQSFRAAASAWWLQNIMSRYITPVRSRSWWLKNQKHISCKSERVRVQKTWHRQSWEPGWCLRDRCRWQAAAPAPTWRLVTPPVGHIITCLPMCGHTIAWLPAPTVFVMNFSFPVSPAAKLARVVQLRTSLCLWWLQTAPCLRLSHVSDLLKNIQDTGALSPLESWASTSQLVMEWGRRAVRPTDVSPPVQSWSGPR